jgi:hypothetical protein
MKNPVRTGTIIALAAGSLFAAACSKGSDTKSTMPMGEKSAAMHCMGANSCKGQGSCKSAKNACKGQNSCKGEGMMETATAEECTAKGGTVTPGHEH